MAQSEAAARSRPSPGADWLMSGLLVVAITVGLGGLGSVLSGVDWWVQSAALAAAMLLAGAAVRSVAKHRVWGSVAALLVAVVAITLLFAPGSALLGLVPTFDSFGELQGLQQAGLESIATQQVPAQAGTGILYLVCLGVAGIALAMDVIAFLFRSPAFTGLPLLLLLLVPAIVSPTLHDGLFFALTAAAWLGILLVRSRRAGRRTALGIGVAALLVALVLPSLLPAPEVGDAGSTGRSGFATGINPIINLGDDLRRGDESLAITYTSNQPDGQYLRLAALDDFSGTAWRPTATAAVPGNDVAAIGAVPGLGAGVPVVSVETKVTVANILSTWLPVPYAPRSVSGLTGDWSWDADALSVRTEKSNARDQVYTVTSVQVAPTVEQLVAAGTTVDAGLERYLVVPDDLPAIVASTARQVVGDATTNYDKAIRLQEFFTGGTFTYSEDAPVKQGYDGSGASVLAAFLTARSGYCVHFSSAMASMARTLGIPARVAVGFTPGTAVAVQGSDVPEYRVTTHDLHAWPELYFSGIGWVRFEPTPGRGVAPAFAPRSVDDPATPNVDESKPVPATTPSPAPSSASIPAPTTGPTSSTSIPRGDAAAPPTPLSPLWVIVPLVALLAIPFVLRSVRRQRRVALLLRGSALAGWDELRDTADDLGLSTSDARTPRQLSADLAGHLDVGGVAALARLRASLENQAFAARGADTNPDDLRAVLRSLRRDAGLAKRLAAAFAPRSLFARWLSRPEVIDPE